MKKDQTALVPWPKGLQFTSESYDRLCRYVQAKLVASNVIPKNHCNPEDPKSVAAGIVYNAWRQPRRFETARFLIGIFIALPPQAIDAHHFSLEFWVKEVNKP